MLSTGDQRYRGQCSCSVNMKKQQHESRFVLFLSVKAKNKSRSIQSTPVTTKQIYLKNIRSKRSSSEKVEPGLTYIRRSGSVGPKSRPELWTWKIQGPAWRRWSCITLTRRHQWWRVSLDLLWSWRREQNVVIFKTLNIEACNTPRCFKVPVFKTTGEAKISLRLCEIL